MISTASTATTGNTHRAACGPRPTVKFTDAYPNWHYPADFVLKSSPYPASTAESAHVVRRSTCIPSTTPSSSSSPSAPSAAAAGSTARRVPSHARSSSSSSARSVGSTRAGPDGPSDPLDPAAPAPPTRCGGVPEHCDPDTVAYYVAEPVSSARPAVRRLVDAFRRPPVYLTSFLYEDPDPSCTSGLRLHRCTRRQLCAAFGALVRDWHRLWTYGMDVLYFVADELPLASGAATPAGPFQERFGEVLAELRAGWRAAHTRLFWGTYLLGDYLEHMSALEDAGRLPARFPRSGLDVTERSVRFPGCSLSRRMPDGRLDDYAFRAAALVLSKPPPIPEVEDAYTDIEGVMWDILEWKGYAPQAVGKYDVLPKTRAAMYETPNRFEPPPPPYHPPSYDDACSSACSSASSSSSASACSSSPRSSVSEL